MALGIMLLDVLKLRRRSERLHIPVQVPHPAVQSRIATPDVPKIAFEMLDVDGVETDDGRIQLPRDTKLADVRRKHTHSRCNFSPNGQVSDLPEYQPP